MSDFLLLMLEDELAHASLAPTALAELMAKRTEFAASLNRRGRLRDHGRFRPSKEGKRVSRNGVVDGPFVEDSKAVAAFYWVDAAHIDEAAQLAAEVPILSSDAVDTRPLMKGIAVPGKQDKPGKVFGLCVLGNADSEPAWSSIMDRIDAETHDNFPADSFLGGNRLQPPSAGQRVAAQGEQRAILDGPFLESKEVIGGLFFLRMMCIDDAVHWAAASRFVVHGTLEIRELWRS